MRRILLGLCAIGLIGLTSCPDTDPGGGVIDPGGGVTDPGGGVKVELGSYFPTGLPNLESVCAFNSVMQVLNSNPCLEDILAMSVSEPKTILLINLFKQMRNQNIRVIDRLDAADKVRAAFGFPSTHPSAVYDTVMKHLYRGDAQCFVGIAKGPISGWVFNFTSPSDPDYQATKFKSKPLTPNAIFGFNFTSLVFSGERKNSLAEYSDAEHFTLDNELKLGVIGAKTQYDPEESQNIFTLRYPDDLLGADHFELFEAKLLSDQQGY